MVGGGSGSGITEGLSLSFELQLVFHWLISEVCEEMHHSERPAGGGTEEEECDFWHRLFADYGETIS